MMIIPQTFDFLLATKNHYILNSIRISILIFIQISQDYRFPYVLDLDNKI